MHSTRNFPPPPPDWGPSQIAAYQSFKTRLLRLQEVLDQPIVRLPRAEAYSTIQVGRRLLMEIASIEADHPHLVFTNRPDIEQSLLLGEYCFQPLFQRASSTTCLVAIVDSESTGLGDDAQPISVGVILVEVDEDSGGVLREVATYYGTREPTVEITPAAAAVNGFSVDRLRGTAFDMKALYKIVDSAYLLVAHNAKFDRRMLAHVMPRVVHARWACTLELLPQYWRRPSPRAWTLDAICAAVGVQRVTPHHALEDCRSLLSVLSANRGTTERSRRFLACLLREAGQT